MAAQKLKSVAQQAANRQVDTFQDMSGKVVTANAGEYWEVLIGSTVHTIQFVKFTVWLAHVKTPGKLGIKKYLKSKIKLIEKAF